MNIFNKSLCCALLASALLGSALAQASVYTDENGRKIECTDTTTTTTQDKPGHPVLGTLAGAAIGGVAGHQVGSGRGRDVATVVGAGAGAAVGHHLSKDKTETSTATQTNCHPLTP